MLPKKGMIRHGTSFASQRALGDMPVFVTDPVSEYKTASEVGKYAEKV
ncbi:hypothetical protein ACOBQJ_03140 [Pelotomaculum propionicicum]